jgi:hypothetical protein
MPPLRRSSPGSIASFAAVLGAILALPSRAGAQLDGTWTVRVGGQAVQVDDDGSFGIPNIALRDLAPADFLGDEFVRVTGISAGGGSTRYAASEFFQLRQGETYRIQQLVLSDTPPPVPVSIRLSAPSKVLAVGETLQLAATASLADGSTVDVTARFAGTLFTVSNAALAGVSEDGLVAAFRPGPLSITASNQGSTAVLSLSLVAEAATTTVEGFVELPDGAPVSGAEVTTAVGGSATTGVDGRFSLEATLPPDLESLRVSAAAEIAGVLYDGAALVPLVPSGITDAGIIRLSPKPTDICDPGFSSAHGAPGLNSNVVAQLVFDDGSGPALYVGGGFTATSSGATPLRAVARWDGSSWSPLGAGFVTGVVLALAAFDDGSGAALHAAGTIGGAVSKWNGAEWLPLPSAPNGSVSALAVYDDGSGPALYAGGAFTLAGGAPANAIARWDGAAWTAPGGGLSVASTVLALAVYDDGSGPALYAGGDFFEAGGVPASNIARWDGSSWASLGGGATPGTSGTVDVLVVHDDGRGPALYAGGFFIFAGGRTVNRIARWDGRQWSAMANGAGSGAARVLGMAVYDDGAGPALYAGGNSLSFGPGLFGNVGRWDGARWSVVDGTIADAAVKTLAVYDDGGGSQLYAGGPFIALGELRANRIARWDGESWSALGSGLNDGVTALEVGAGPEPLLYAAGGFRVQSGAAPRHVAAWDGRRWAPLGEGLDAGPLSLETFDDGSGPALHAAGFFSRSGARVLPGGVAKWDGAEWQPLGAGLGGFAMSLRAFDDGSGAALYAGGSFDAAGGLPASNVARWNGAAWAPLGDGLDAHVRAWSVFDDGSGPALYAAGAFQSTAGVPIGAVARWSGASWVGVGGGITGSPFSPPEVFALAVHDDGRGPALYAGGTFDSAGASDAVNIARWDGEVWESLGVVDARVRALIAYDDGGGAALYAGGEFATAGGVPALFAARWSGSEWSALGQGLNNRVDAFAVLPSPGGSALYLGGAFTVADGRESASVAQWARRSPPCPDEP